MKNKPTRLSRKAHEAADVMSATFGLRVREMAPALAEGREFADERDVNEAWKIVIKAMAAAIT